MRHCLTLSLIALAFISVGCDETTNKTIDETTDKTIDETTDKTKDETPGPEISKKCLRCICLAMSRCNFGRGCSTTMTGKKICGAFQMTKVYWIDGGRLAVKGDESNIDEDKVFENCANEARCARQSVKNYMNRYKRDCNDDGKINCEDFARMHGFGPSGCSQTSGLTNNFYRAFSTCKRNLPLTDDD